MYKKLIHAIFVGLLLVTWVFLSGGLLWAAEKKLPLYGKSRTWTMAGQPLVAKLISADDGWITLESEDGTSKRHMLGFASQADQAFVRSFLEIRLKQVPAKFRKSRSWTDKSGKVLGEGPISSASDKDVFIIVDGKPKGLFFPFLSDEDKKFIAEFLEASPANPAAYAPQPNESNGNLNPRDFRPMKDALIEKFGQVRTWTDTTGEFQTRATLHSASEVEVRLVLENGHGLTLKRGQIAEADRDFLDEFLVEWIKTPDAPLEEVDPAMPNNPFEQLPTSIRLADAFVPERELHEYGQRRVWKDHSGFHFVEAHLLAANQQTVQLKLENLRYINIPVEKLDASDRKLVEEFVLQAEKQVEKIATMKRPTPNTAKPRTRTSIDVQTISLSERTADFSQAKRLSFSTQKSWKVGQLSAVANREQPPSDVVIGLEQCDNVCLATQSPVALVGQFQLPFGGSRLAIAMPEPADQLAYEFGDSWRLMHISPDGTSAVLLFHHKSDCRVGIVDIQGTEIVPRFQFVTHDEKNQNIERAFLLSRDRLVTVLFKNVVIVWDLTPETGPVALARYDPSGVEFRSEHFAVAPGGEVFAFMSSGGILLVERELGEIVGKIPGLDWRGIGISPDGRQIAVAKTNKIQVFDMQTGTKVTEFPSLHAFMNRIIWPDERHLLVDGVLYSLKHQRPICTYAEHKDLAIGQGEYFPLLDFDSSAKTSRIHFLKLPEHSATQLESTMKQSDTFAAYPGCKLRLVVQLVDGAESAQLREKIMWELKKTLEKNDWKIVDDAPTVILVRVEGLTTTRTFKLKRSTVGSVVNTLKGIFGNSDEQEEEVTIECKGWKQTLEVKHLETTLVSQQHYVDAPDKFDVNINESIKDAAKRATKPDPKWFSTVELENPLPIPVQRTPVPNIKLADQ